MSGPPAVPACDCITKYTGPTLHRRGCPRLAAIVALWAPWDAELAEQVAGELEDDSRRQSERRANVTKGARP